MLAKLLWEPIFIERYCVLFHAIIKPLSSHEKPAVGMMQISSDFQPSFSPEVDPLDDLRGFGRLETDGYSQSAHNGPRLDGSIAFPSKVSKVGAVDAFAIAVYPQSLVRCISDERSS